MLPPFSLSLVWFGMPGWNVIGAHLVVDDLLFYPTDIQSSEANPFTDIIIEGFAPGHEPETED